MSSSSRIEKFPSSYSSESAAWKVLQKKKNNNNNNSEGKDQNSDSDDFENDRYTKKCKPAPWVRFYFKSCRIN